MNPYQRFVSALADAYRQAKQIPLGASPKPAKTLPDPTAPRALIFSPHPDDEVIIGGLPLRLLRELRWNVINVAVTLGSNRDRQSERWEELRNCCDFIGFALESTGERGLEAINLTARGAQMESWRQAVRGVAGLLTTHRPSAIFFPHDEDWNSTHIGTHHLVVDALATLDRGVSLFTIETEFWAPMAAPNLLVESSERDIVDLITALSFHLGEVRRNPYHLRMPGWLMDNVRRGGELVGGQGGAAPDFLFGTLYRLRRWRLGQLEPVLKKGQFVACADDLGPLLAS